MRKKMISDGKREGLSIFYRLLITSLGVVIGISSILTVVFYVYSKKSYLENTKEFLFQQSKTIGQHLSHRLKEDIIRDLRTLADDLILQKYLASSEADREINALSVQRMFENFLAREKSFLSVSFVDFMGKEKIRVNNAGPSREYRNFKDNHLFHHIESGCIEEMHIIDPIRKTAEISSIFMGRSLSDPDIGKFGGAVIVEYSLKEFFASLDNILIFGENPVWLFAADGRVLKQPENQKAILDPRPFLQNYHQDCESADQNASCHNHEIPELIIADKGMVVRQDICILPSKPLLCFAISIPSTLILKEIQSTLSFFPIVLTAFFALTAILVFWTSRYLSKPIIELASATSAMTHDLEFNQVEVTSTGEVKTLVESFNQMAQVLHHTTVSRDYVDKIINTMHNTLVVVSPEFKIQTVNSAVCELLGYSSKELIDQPIEKIIAAESMRKWHGYFGRKPEICRNIELTYRAKDNTGIPVLFSNAIIHDGDGNIQSHVCVAQDITDRKEIENALLISKERFRDIAHSSGDWIWEIDNNGRYTFSSGNYKELLGYGLNEIIGKKFSDFLDPEEVERLDAIFADTASRMVPIVDLENWALNKEGKKICLLTNAVPRFKANEELIGYRGVDKDITERKQVQEELEKAHRELKENTAAMLQTAKLSALGEMAAGVAHELNQPLNGIKIISQGILRDIDKDRLAPDELPNDLKDINHQVDRMARIIDHMRIYSRTTIDEDVHEIDVNEAVEGVFKLIGQQLTIHNIKVKKELAPDLPMALMDQVKLEQVIMNLLTNARQALEQFRKENMTIEVKSYLNDNQELVISVRDNGGGIPAEIRDKIFEPFFTTKRPGSGTGLGLGISREILENSGGRIEFEIDEGEGTTFLVILKADKITR